LYQWWVYGPEFHEDDEDGCVDGVVSSQSVELFCDATYPAALMPVPTRRRTIAWEAPGMGMEQWYSKAGGTVTK
jgi:hypothetical protein